MAVATLRRWASCSVVERLGPDVPNGWLYEATPSTECTAATMAAGSVAAGVPSAGMLRFEPNPFTCGDLDEISSPGICSTPGYRTA